MFSTFVGVDGGDKGQGNTSQRRSVVGKACVECRRRKTKCSGTSPCSACNACNVQCVFPELRRRGKLPRKAVAKPKNGEYSEVISRLFGDVSIQSLKDLSRSELLELISAQDGNSRIEPVASLVASSPRSKSLEESWPSPTWEASIRLQQLQHETSSTIFEWDEVSAHPQKSVEDDVNGLSLSLNRKSSYVGISSVAAAVRALSKVIPDQLFEQTSVPSKKSQEERLSPTIQSMREPSPNQRGGSSYHERQRLIDSYFAAIHVFAPVIHEPTFRNSYLSNSRSDPPWLALLNIVFALGSIAISPGDSDEDIPYYEQAQKYLTLESFGAGCLETLQALVLMGGMYLHHRNRPNMASAIMGACYRVAHGLGLHFEASEGSQNSGLAEELKRRTWWTIYVLDIWGSVTLGRPLIASRYFPEPPRNLLDDQHGDVPPTEPTIHSPLIHNIQLCSIITRVQDRLLVSPILNIAELDHYDNMLVSWFEDLPEFLRSTKIPAPGLQDARAVLKWRYENIRLLLHRPLVLDTLLRQTSFHNLSSDEQTVVKKCRELAAEAILSIQCEWRSNKISCWNAIWFLFQACLVPIMALAIEPPETENYQSWISQAQMAIATCTSMSDLTLAGHKTRAFLERLLLAALKLPNWTPQSQLHGDFQAPLQSAMELLSDEWDLVTRQEFVPGFNSPDFPYLDGPPVYQQYHVP